MLYADNLVLVCRQQHPALSEPLTIENLRNYDHSSFMTEGQSNHGLRQRIDEIFPERQISFSSYNMFTTASLIGSSGRDGMMHSISLLPIRDAVVNIL